MDKRRLLIEGTRCQVIPSKLGHPTAEYPYASYFPLYLPRKGWADALIYVSVLDAREVFHIVPRSHLSKDTGFAPESMRGFREAWDSLRIIQPATKDFETVNWQLGVATEAARKAGLSFKLIQRKNYQKGGRWPPVIKRRVIIQMLHAPNPMRTAHSVLRLVFILSSLVQDALRFLLLGTRSGGAIKGENKSKLLKLLDIVPAEATTENSLRHDDLTNMDRARPLNILLFS